MEWLQPFVDEEYRLVLSMHALMVETPNRTIMVDTCIGNDKPRSYPRWNYMQSDFLQRFEAAGFTREGVDTVLCTHMHVDHVGWNTLRVEDRWVPTFGNARYLFSANEWAHWEHEEQEYGPVIEDSVQPIFDAGLATLVRDDYQVCDEVSLFSTPGHTPGHISVHIRSLGEEAVITGDMMHHPCQIPHTDWVCSADHDGELAQQTRRAFVERFEGTPTLIIGTHFAGPTAGRIVRDGSTFRLDY